MVTSKRNAFKFSITRLLKSPGEISEVQASGILDDVFVTSARLEPNEFVDVHGTLESVHSGVLFVGYVTATIKTECRRCLGTTNETLNVELRELFEKEYHEEIGDTYPISGEYVDLTEMVRESLILALPAAPLCHNGCLGICQICGLSLNENACNHPDDGIDPRFRILDQLK